VIFDVVLFPLVAFVLLLDESQKCMNKPLLLRDLNNAKPVVTE